MEHLINKLMAVMSSVTYKGNNISWSSANVDNIFDMANSLKIVLLTPDV